jgi:hypothetical protein
VRKWLTRPTTNPPAAAPMEKLPSSIGIAFSSSSFLSRLFFHITDEFKRQRRSLGIPPNLSRTTAVDLSA